MDRPLSSLLSDLRLPGHRQMAEHWLLLYEESGRTGRRCRASIRCAFPKHWPIAGSSMPKLMAASACGWRVRP